ncbi:hypothetical protein SAY87_027863 [Trapa incisa]|uniref:Uncharacterized protein n=2 Tax=Trapa TaxID=22665 RepID=A0AAN7MCS2_TRANT|nr:hypothetical protein SAY87_027863 [Trapa incisa]KAK4801176.1 hypothetical protein SAY86_021663 [Trapa natans]
MISLSRRSKGLSSSHSLRMRKTRRRSALASRLLSRRSRQGKRRNSSPDQVSEKLEWLRSLIPAGRGQDHGSEDEAVAPATDRLFQETADYILRLRAQVIVLHRLIQLYGCDCSEDASIPSAAVV